MCSGCNWPGCGGFCGTDDYEREDTITVEVTCKLCGFDYEYDGEVTFYGGPSSSMESYYAEIKCPVCEHEQELEGEREIEKYVDDSKIDALYYD